MEGFVIRVVDICTDSFPESPTQFQAASGETTAIIGNNGEGKTTLAKVLTGTISKRSGYIYLSDSELGIHSIAPVHRNGIFPLQESLQPFPDKNVMDDLLLGIEQSTFHNRFLNSSKVAKEAVCRSILSTLGLELELNDSTDRPAVGKKYLLQIGWILPCNSKILTMDEFSASLTDLETRRILGLLDELKQKNICIILISHKYSSVIRHCDSITVIEDGFVISSHSRRELEDEDLLKRVLDLKKDLSYPRLPHTLGRSPLTAEHICCGILHDIFFSLQEGELLGIAGVVGSGRTTFVNAICRERNIFSGRLHYAPSLERPGAINILSNDDRDDLFLSDKDISFDITSPNVQKASHFQIVSHQKLDIYARDYMHRPGIKKADYYTLAAHLSHGEQQKVLIAHSLYQNAKLYIFDEPSSNLDIQSRSELYNIYNALFQQGASTILISCDFSGLIGTCDCILLLRAGEQVRLCPTRQIIGEFLYSVLKGD